jgi:hypothetical protein
MPACFQLISKVTKKPTDFITVDDAICKHMNVEPDPVNYYMHWYDSIGFALAMGRTFEELKTRYTKGKNQVTDPEEVESYEKALEVVAFLDEHYEANSWHEHRGF